jgi:hypothetical protein
VIDRAAQDEDSNAAAAESVQLELVGRIARRLQPMHSASGGELGFVSIQGNPAVDHDPAAIVAEALRGRDLGPNVAPKIPATAAGLEAFDQLVADGHPTIVTEVFSLAQLIEVNERYLAATSPGKIRPALFISPISGIFGDYLRTRTTEEFRVAGPPPPPELAGIVVARACDDLSRSRGYPGELLVGGARKPVDLLGLVPRPVHATINWTTFEEINALDPDLAAPVDGITAGMTADLASAFDEVRLALDPDALTIDEFERFPPVQFFRSMFVHGWDQLESAIRAARRLSSVLAVSD